MFLVPPKMPQQKTQTDGVRLLDQVRGRIRLKHYSIRTEQAYVDWIKRYILFFDKRHPRDLGVVEVEALLTHLAKVKALHEEDSAQGYGEVYLPFALDQL